MRTQTKVSAPGSRRLSRWNTSIPTPSAFTATTDPDITSLSPLRWDDFFGNRFDGKIVQTISSSSEAHLSPTTPGRAGSFILHRRALVPSEYAFVVCEDQASFINIGDYSVTTIDLKLGEFYIPKSIAVSPDGTKAYVSTGGQTPTWYPAKLVTLDATAGKVAQTLSLAKSPVPSGFVSLAMAGDGVTLYGSGVDFKQTTTLIVAHGRHIRRYARQHSVCIQESRPPQCEPRHGGNKSSVERWQRSRYHAS